VDRSDLGTVWITVVAGPGMCVALVFAWCTHLGAFAT